MGQYSVIKSKKNIIISCIGLVFSILIGQSLVARAYVCSEVSLMKPDSQKAIGFIQSIEGYYEGGGCQVSIEVCDSGGGNRTEYPTIGSQESTLVGEILVVDKKGRELYLPLDFRSSNSARTKSSILNGSRVFHYEYTDLNRDPNGAGYELYHFEAVKNPKKTKLEYVEFGIIGKNDKRIHWSICKGLEKI